MRRVLLFLWLSAAPLLAQDASSYDSLMASCRQAVSAQDYDTAQTAAQKASQLDPNGYEAHYYLALIYHHQHLDAPAITELKTALSLAPDEQKEVIQNQLTQLSADFDATQNVAKAQAADQAGRTFEAAEYYEKAWIAKPADEKSALAAAEDYALSTIDPVAAFSIWKALSDGMDTTDDTRNTCRQKLANYIKQDGSTTDEYENQMTKALGLAEDEFLKGNLDLAEWRWVHLARLDKDNAEAPLVLARIDAIHGDVPGVIKHLNAARKINAATYVGTRMSEPKWYYVAEFAALRKNPAFQSYLANSYAEDELAQVRANLNSASDSVEGIIAFCGGGDTKIVPIYRNWDNGKTSMSDRSGDVTLMATEDGVTLKGSGHFLEKTANDGSRNVYDISFSGKGRGLVRACTWNYQEAFGGDLQPKGYYSYAMIGWSTDSHLVISTMTARGAIVTPSDIDGSLYYFDKN